MIRVSTPDHAGSRDQAKALAAALPAELDGETVLLDCSALVIGTPSFLDEIVKQVLVIRDAEVLEISGAPERAGALLERAAENRSVRERIRVALRAA
jgi:hypothetical protein